MVKPIQRREDIHYINKDVGTISPVTIRKPHTQLSLEEDNSLAAFLVIKCFGNLVSHYLASTFQVLHMRLVD